MELTATDLARLCGAALDGPTPPVHRPLRGITTDSREVAPGGAFVALRGEAMDGHAFVAAAGVAGASCALVDDGWTRVDEAPPLLLRVADTGVALRSACSARLEALGATVIGITGSVGKTTAKEMLAHVLAGDRAVARTAGNLNTWTGVPLSILRHTGPAQAVVAEMGMSAPGEIADLCSFTHPRVGVLLNIGLSHIELLGTRAAIARAKGELLEALPADGLAVCNADDDEVRALITRGVTRARTVWFGSLPGPGGAPSYLVTAPRARGLEGSTFTLVTPAGSLDMAIAAPGLHLAGTAAACTAVALEMGVAPTTVVERLAAFTAVEQRGVVRAGVRGARIIDDSYNAAPASMAAALDLLAASGSEERVAVLGDMLELGAESDRAHDEVGHHAGSAATLLVAAGPQAQRLVDAAVAAGLPPERALVAGSVDTAAALAVAACSPATTVLVKGSHGVHLEAVVARLVT